jgi:stage III sporulation protein AD
MELLWRIAALAMLGVLAGAAIKRGALEYGYLVGLAAVAAILLALSGPAGEVAAMVRMLGERSGLPRELTLPVFRVVGIALVTRITAEFCRDAKETAIAAAVETGGVCLALVATAPLLGAVLSMFGELAW